MNVYVDCAHFNAIVAGLCLDGEYAVDTETTGLRPYHGHEIFGVSIATARDSYYFNFKEYPDTSHDLILPREWLKKLLKIFDNTNSTFYLHNALFDLHMFAQEGIFFKGTIWCTKAQERVVYNDHLSYSLDACAKRIGEEKDNAVEKYISEHHLWEWENIPGKRARKKNKFYALVPYPIMAKYACQDAAVCYRLGQHQKAALEKIAKETGDGLPGVWTLSQREARLTKTVFRMERAGVLIDRDYCRAGIAHEKARATAALRNFKEATGSDKIASPLVLREAFKDLKDRWEYTEKNNPCFESEVLQKFNTPIAKEVLTYRDAKARGDFFHGFIYHADANHRIHPHFDQSGTASGRFSSSEPNFQNLSRTEEAESYPIRRAIIPSPGFMLAMFDYKAMEYYMAIEYSARLVGRTTPLLEAVKAGKDVHQATADLVKEVTGIEISRQNAKNANFAKIYGAGYKKLSEMLGCSYEKAASISQAIDQASPEMADFCRGVIRAAETRGYVFNWSGRRCHFPNAQFAYKAPNYLIQGGCADVVKEAMNRIDTLLQNYRTRMVMQVHDELVFEASEDETHVLPLIQNEMENAFPALYLPMKVSSEYSHKSLADGIEGFP